MKRLSIISGLLTLLITTPAFAGGGGEAIDMPLYMSIPFVMMLLSIAVFPLVREHWWENNWNKLLVSGILGVPMLGYLIYRGLYGKIEHALLFDYVPFIILLGSLYVISGGIRLTGDLKATPRVNATFLAIGAVLASFVGTTGAAMLLIRPLLSTNAERKKVVHTVVFFIFMVANIGGCLTPLGDPPLFLGYLRGVPFTWEFNLIVPWAVMNTLLLAIYFVWDSIAYKKEDIKDIQKDKAQVAPLRITGKINFLWLGAIVASVAYLNGNYINIIHENHYFAFIREAVMLGVVGISIWTTPAGLRKANKFTMHPINEVAFLFIGIFITMIPALIYLESHSKSLGLSEPWHYFWATGLLSSFLDNAPTYVTFFTTAIGQASDAAAAAIDYLPDAQEAALVGKEMLASELATMQVPADAIQAIGPDHEMLWVKDGPEPDLIDEAVLVAISLGAVFMGANTYIGNGPNFMVKAVAEEAGIKMPSFFGYMLYSGAVLIPLLVLITFLFIL